MAIHIIGHPQQRQTRCETGRQGHGSLSTEMTAGLPTRESRGGCCGTRRAFVTPWKDTRRVNPRNLISTRALRRSIAGATLAGLLAGGAAFMPSNSSDAQAAATPIYWG